MRWGLALVLLTVLSTVGAAQEPLTGTINVDPSLVVKEGERLVLGPGAVLTGPGPVQVWGSLEARGTAANPIEFQVPVEVLGPNATVLLQHVRLWGVRGAAVSLQGGAVTIEDALFEGNEVGIRADAPEGVVLSLRNATLRDHADAAALLDGRLDVLMRNVTLATNARHLQLGTTDGARFVLEDARIRAPTTRAPSLLVRAVGNATVETREATFDGGDVAVRLEGDGVHYASESDAFLRVRVGLSLDAGEATVTRARFDAFERDVDAGPAARLSFRDVRFTPAAVAAPAPASPVGGSAWWVLGGALVLVGAVVAYARLRPRAAPAPLPVVEAPAPLPPDLASPISDVERRILRDVAEHPGTAQAAIAQRLGVTRQALHYHVKKLEARRLIRKEAHGRETRCTLAAGAEVLLSS